MRGLRSLLVNWRGYAFMFFGKIYVVLRSPWIIARFYSAWEEYQKSVVYRERLFNLGFEYAFEFFFKNRWEWDYHLKNRLVKEPELAVRIRWMPWTIEVPALLETTSASGFFNRTRLR